MVVELWLGWSRMFCFVGGEYSQDEKCLLIKELCLKVLCNVDWIDLIVIEWRMIFYYGDLRVLYTWFLPAKCIQLVNPLSLRY